MNSTFNDMPSSSKVWIYQSDRILNSSEKERIQHALDDFLQSWHSHQQDLRAYGQIWHDAFIVIMVDENVNMASGCSIDKSVHLVKDIESQIGVSLMDRMNFAYIDKEGAKIVSKDVFASLIEAGKIDDDTRVFNNLVSTKAEFEEKWKIPLAQSWHKQLI